MIGPVSDELIMACADGELDGREAARVHAALRASAAARRKHAIFRATRALCADVFDGTLAEPVPERLTASLSTAPERVERQQKT